MTKRKKLFVWASILSGLMCAIYAVAVYALLNNVDGFAVQLQEIIRSFGAFTEAEIVELMNSMGENFIFYSIVNGVSCAMFVTACFLNEKWFGRLKYVILGICAFNILFSVNFLSSILGIVACFVRVERAVPVREVVPEEIATQNLSYEDIRAHLKLKNMAEKISLIKNLRQEGGISEEEYAKLLNEIISTGVKE